MVYFKAITVCENNVMNYSEISHILYFKADNVSRRKRSVRFPNMDLWPLFNNREGSKIPPQLKIAALRYLVASKTIRIFSTCNIIDFGGKVSEC